VIEKQRKIWMETQTETQNTCALRLTGIGTHRDTDKERQTHPDSNLQATDSYTQTFTHRETNGNTQRLS
jgi:hypothetical protein